MGGAGLSLNAGGEGLPLSLHGLQVLVGSSLWSLPLRSHDILSPCVSVTASELLLSIRTPVMLHEKPTPFHSDLILTTHVCDSFVFKTKSHSKILGTRTSTCVFGVQNFTLAKISMMTSTGSWVRLPR